MTSLVAGIVLSSLVCMAVRAASGLDGTWRGTYNSQPTALMPDGSYPEKVNAFELRLQDKKGTISGDFSTQDETRKIQPVKNGKRFGNRACFDIVLDSDDMRWCVEARGNRLSGTWSEGPQGGPLLNGAGAGARLFKITAARVD